MRLLGLIAFNIVLLVGCASKPCVQAQGLGDDPDARSTLPVNVQLISGRILNLRGEHGYLYTATIDLVVEERDRAFIEDRVQERQARIAQGVIEIIARAEPAVLNDPERIALNQALCQLCHEQFGNRADGTPYVTDIVISGWMRTRWDS